MKKVLVLLVVLLLMGFYLLPAVKNRIDFSGSRPGINGMATNFSLTDLQGKKVDLSDLRGKVVLVNFWASWCSPCKMEIPGFQRVYEAYKGRGFVVIGIALDDVKPSFIRDMGMTYPVVMADNKVVKDYGNVRMIPTSFLIDKDGRIIKKIMGIYPDDTLRIDVENALKDKG
ncbi:MAG: hypothetical protein A2Z09_04425 [Nitrospirae bacterium RBG_16_43_8]|nr:MAG: hypothetical protein A2Z09_04425 [Nitrospirae bacterium RBG_16_43_8]